MAWSRSPSHLSERRNMLRISDYNGVEYVGIYATANEAMALVPMDSDDRFLEDISTALVVKCSRGTIASTNLIGALVAMNSYGAAVTNFSHRRGDRRLFQSERRQAGGPPERLRQQHPGQRHGCLVNPEMNDRTVHALEEGLQRGGLPRHRGRAEHRRLGVQGRPTRV